MTITEAGSYAKLTQQEKQQLASLPHEIGSHIASIVSSFRTKGKNIDLFTAAQQLNATPHFKGNADLGKFIASSAFGAQNVPGMKQNVVPPPSHMRPLPPKEDGPTPGDQFQKRLAGQLDFQNPDIDKEKAKQVFRSGNINNPGKAALPVPQSDFERQLTARKAKNLQPQQKFAPISQPPNNTPVPPTNPSIAYAPTIMAPKNTIRQNQSVYKSFPKPKPMKSESINPMAMAQELRQIQNLLSRIKPEHLMAVAEMVSELMQSKKQGTGTTMENKQIVTEAIKQKLVEQIEARNTAQRLLEGPLGNVWDTIKGAGTAIGQKMGLMGQAGQQAQQVGADENQKRVAQELTKLIGKANQQRQKFNSSILKNAEAMNAYHDIVMQLVQGYQQTYQILGPFGQQLYRQIEDAVHNLQYDLTSEKSQIDTFLQQLKVNSKGSKSSKDGPAFDVDLTKTGEDRLKGVQDNRRKQENPSSYVAGKVGTRRDMPLASAGIAPGIHGAANLDKLAGERQGADMMAQFGKDLQDPQLTMQAGKEKKRIGDMEQVYRKQITSRSYDKSGKSKKKSSSKKKKK